MQGIYNAFNFRPVDLRCSVRDSVEPCCCGFVNIACDVSTDLLHCLLQRPSNPGQDRFLPAAVCCLRCSAKHASGALSRVPFRAFPSLQQALATFDLGAVLCIWKFGNFLSPSCDIYAVVPVAEPLLWLPPAPRPPVADRAERGHSLPVRGPHFRLPTGRRHGAGALQQAGHPGSDQAARRAHLCGVPQGPAPQREVR